MKYDTYLSIHQKLYYIGPLPNGLGNQQGIDQHNFHQRFNYVKIVLFLITLYRWMSLIIAKNKISKYMSSDSAIYGKS